jgi:ribosomal 30S subunit maturation factor RimM
VDSDYNPLLEVEVGGVQELIPAVDDFIVEIDEAQRRVIFSLPEGLLGLNDTE